MTPGKLENDGLERPQPASLLVRCVALAVDIFATLACACTGFALVTLVVPADSASAKLPVFLITIAAFVYLAMWRTRWASMGRYLFKLCATRVAGTSGMPGRMTMVHTQAVALSRPVIMAVALSVAACVLSAGALSQVLVNTEVYRQVMFYTVRQAPLSAEHGAVPVLSPVPSALLIGNRRAYVQTDAVWGTRSGLLEFFLRRERDRWRVVAVQQSDERQLFRYALAIEEAQVPVPDKSTKGLKLTPSTGPGATLSGVAPHCRLQLDATKRVQELAAQERFDSPFK